MGTWIGGDRDGNPFVTAEVMRGAAAAGEPGAEHLSRRAARLGAELSLAAHLADTEELRALAERRPNRRRTQRRALSPRAIRHLRPAGRDRAETRGRDHAAAVGEAEPYASAKEFKADLDVLDRSLIANNSGVIARGRLRVLRRAVDCSASISPGSTSGRIPRCMSAWSRSCSSRDPGMSYLALTRRPASTCCSRELRSARPLSSAFVKYSEETLGELACSAPPPRRMRHTAPDAIPQCIISKCKGMSDMLEVAVLLKEVGLVNPSGRSAINIVPLFETIEDLQASAGIMDRMLSLHDYRSWSTAAAASRR